MGERGLGLAGRGEVLAEPPLADLRVALWRVPERAERVFGGDEELRRGECGDEDDASVRLEREGVWRRGMLFEGFPLYRRLALVLCDNVA